VCFLVVFKFYKKESVIYKSVIGRVVLESDCEKSWIYDWKFNWIIQNRGLSAMYGYKQGFTAKKEPYFYDPRVPR